MFRCYVKLFDMLVQPARGQVVGPNDFKNLYPQAASLLDVHHKKRVSV